MSIYCKVLPYVYRLDNPITGEFYIGYREANKEPSHIDFPKYKTSAPYIKSRFDEFRWQIIAEFFDGESAFIFEQSQIKENFNVPGILNRRYYENGTYKMFKLIGDKNGMFGKTHTVEVKNKISKINKGRDKGKTYEQIYGFEKAKQLRLSRKVTSTGKDNSGSKNSRALKIKATSPNGEIFTIIGNIDKFCESHKLNAHKVRDNYKRNIPHPKGWEFIIID